MIRLLSLCVFSLWGALTLLMAGAHPVVQGDRKESENRAPGLYVPAGVKTGKRPTTTKGELWRVVIVTDCFQSYADPRGPKKFDLPENGRPKFGDVVYVMAEDDKAHRNLLARFERNKFVKYLGWADRTWLLDHPLGTIAALTVASAREQLKQQLKQGGDRAEWRTKSRDLLPRTDSGQFLKIPLKAVTHPERGPYCFQHPLPQGDERAAIAAQRGIALQPFGFYHVYKIILQGDGHPFCLVAPKPQTAELKEEADTVSDLAGWVDTDNLVLWTSREAFEFNLSNEAFAARKRSKNPITMFRTREHLERWLDPTARNTDGKVIDSLGKPIEYFQEDLGRKGKEWDAAWMRFPIFEGYNLPNKRKGYRIAALGQRKGFPPLSQKQIETYRLQVQRTLENMRVIELVLVVDLTNSMQPVFEPLKKATVTMIEQLQKVEAGRPEPERIHLRVGVVGYRDFTDDPKAPPLLEDGSKYFEMRSAQGLREFGEYMDSLKAGGGGDLPEQPFEGIDWALRKYLRSGDDSLHQGNAAAIAVVLGDAGNHDEAKGTYNYNDGRKDTGAKPKAARRTLTTADMLSGNRLKPLGQVGSMQTAEVTLHAVFTETALSREWEKKDITGRPKTLWDAQMPGLARNTGGTSHFVPFVVGQSGKVDPEDIKKGLRALEKVLSDAVEARRKLIAQQMEVIRAQVSGEQPIGPILNLTEAIIEQTISEKEWEQIKKGLASTCFIPFHTMADFPDKTGKIPWMRTCVLLTRDEFLDIRNSCKWLYIKLDKLNKKANPNVKYNEALVLIMQAAFGGEDLDLEEIRKLSKEYTKNPRELQKKLSALPVLFRCLEHPKPNAAAIRRMSERLKRCTDAFDRILSEDRDKRRFFQNAFGKGETYIWIDADILP